MQALSMEMDILHPHSSSREREAGLSSSHSDILLGSVATDVPGHQAGHNDWQGRVKGKVS